LAMKPQLPNIIPFPFDAQSNPFYCALASVLLPALGYTEETPYFCAPKGSNCVECGGCKKTMLQRNHLLLYHDYQSFTGVSFGWTWPELDSDYHTIENAGAGWRWPDEFINFIMGHAGLTWRRFSKGADKNEAYRAITASIDAGIPALLKLGAGQNWHVVTGYRDGALFALTYKEKGCLLRKWHDAFEDVIIVTGHCEPTVGCADVFRRIISVLEHPAHVKLEADLYRRIDAITKDNAQETARWLNEIVSFPIEARWHAADSSLARLSGDKAVGDKLFWMIRQYVFDKEHDATHGTCWKIWAQLGVSPKTHYQVPKNAGNLALRPETQAELKRLFAIVFLNDREVLTVMREALALL